MKRFTRLSSLVIAALIASVTASVRAGALDDRVPQESLVYVGWAGADALGDSYAKSNLKAILDASAIKEFINKQLPALIEQAGARDPNAPRQIARLQQGLAVAWKHPTAFYLCPIDVTVPQMPAFRFGLVCEAGTDAKVLSDLLNEAVAAVPQNPVLPIRVIQEGTTVMLLFGKAEGLEDLKKAGGLAASPLYKAAMNNARQDNPAIAAYVDIKGILATVNEGLSKVPNTPADVKERVPAVIEAMGLNGLTQIAIVGGFNAKAGWSSHNFIGTSGPRKGLLAIMDAGPLSRDALAAVPKDAAALAVWKMDLGKIFTEARTAIGTVDPQAQKEFDAGVAEMGANIGLNIENDFLKPLGDEWVLYRAPLSDEGGNSPALVAHLKDGATLAKTITKLEALYNAIPNTPIKIEKITAAKTDVSTLAFMQYSAAWTVKGDMLYVSSLSGIGGAIRQVEGKAPSIIENEDYKAAMAVLPQGVQPISISYTYPAKLYPELRRAALGLIPVIRRAGFDIPMEILPEGADVSRFMPPGANIVWSAPDGFHGAGDSAFPGAEMLGGQQAGPGAVAMLAVGGAVALPNIARTRTVSSRTVDMANLRGISQSSLVYAADHKDAMPDDLARLVADGMIAPKSLVSRRAGTAPLEMTPELEKLAKDDFAKFSAEVAAHCDFVYLGKDSKSELNAGVIIAYEKPSSNTLDGLNVAFQDGHAEFVPLNRLPAAFEATNVALKKMGKAEVDVKALQRAAGFVDGAGLP